MFERFLQRLRPKRRKTRRCKHAEWTERTGPHYDGHGDAYYEVVCRLCGYHRVIR